MSMRLAFGLVPPKQPGWLDQYLDEVTRLVALQPDFLAVPAGLGLPALQSATQLATELREAHGAATLLHVTALGQSREQLHQLAQQWWQDGFHELLAVRGDVTAQPDFRPAPGAHENAAALVAGLRRAAPFRIWVAGYPEGHPFSPDSERELDFLRAKLDAGATGIMAQFTYEAEPVLRYRDRLAKAGILVPLVPGLAPVHHVASSWRFCLRNGVRIAPWLADLFDGLDFDPPARHLVAVTQAFELAEQLGREGFDRLQIFAFGEIRLAYAVGHLLTRGLSRTERAAQTA